jgi:hypothetical protein
MNHIFIRFRSVGLRIQAVVIRLAITLGIVLIVFFCPAAAPLRAQKSSDSSAEFKNLVADLSAARLNGAEESEAQQEKPLAYLDSIATSVLTVSATLDLTAANQRLAGLLPQPPPVGENYRLVKLGGAPPAYAMVINFGLGGPAAVRIYAATGGHYALASRIDHFAQKDFFDSDVELVPVSGNDSVFVTVSGRTDDLSTGIFSAWLFDGHRVVALWSSDLLQQSNYEADASGFHLTYCGQEDEDRPSQCLKMTRDVYRFEAGEWKRVETSDMPAPKPASK